MPYSGPNDPKLPEHVKKLPEKKRKQWIAIFEDVLKRTGDEGQAMRQANGAVKAAQGSMVLQTVIVSKDLADNLTEAKKIVHDLGFETSKADEKENSWRFRQRPPGDFDPDTFRSKEIKKGVTLVLGKLKQAAKVKNIGIKALDESGRVGGYLVVWGDTAHTDLQGEYFTPETDLGLDWYPRRPMLYHHGLDNEVKAAMIGNIETMQPDDTGVWVEAQLDMRNRWARAVYHLVQKGMLGWSSGTLPHLVDVSRDGHIKRWPIIEGSATPSPAEPRSTDVISRKHYCDAAAVTQAYKTAGLAMPDLTEEDAATEGELSKGQAGQGNNAPARAKTANRKTLPRMEGHTMAEQVDLLTKDEAAQMVADLLKQERERAEREREEADLKAKAARVDELEKDKADLEARIKALEDKSGAGQPARRLPGRVEDTEDGEDSADPNARKSQIIVGSPFDNLTAEELAFGVTVMQQASRIKGVVMRPSEQYANALAYKINRQNLLIQKPGDYKSYYKSDELSHSTQAGYGDEWVPDLWSNELWRKARLDNVILPLFRTVEMPSNPFELPIQGTDPVVYYVPETEDEAQLLLSGSGNAMPDSKIGSGKVTLTAKKLAIRVGFSNELTEDSIVPILSMYTEQALRAMADGIDNVLLNGDTESGATGNINSDDGAPGATDKYMAFNGLRKLGLVTNTANKTDGSGAPTMANLRATRFLMAGKYSVNPNNCAWIVDGATYAKMLSIPEVTTMDKFGPNATAMTGQLAKVDGIPVMVSAEMPLTMADGKVDSTGNTKGQGVCVYRPGWVVGYRRRVVATSTYLPYFDAWQLIATVRIAFINFDTDVASTLYDLTV